jgi:hypothetical protein
VQLKRAMLVGLVVLLGAGEAAAQLLPFTWDVPKVVESIDVPGVMNTNGIPVKLRSVKSTERPEVIYKHLVSRFELYGFYIPPKQKQWLKEPQFTALDTQRLISYTFIIQVNGDDTTTVVLGEANLGQAQKTKPVAFAPVFPGAKDVLTSDLEVGRTLTYLVPGGKATPDVEGFYRKELAQAGYRETEPNLYHRGTEELQVTVRPSKGQLSVLILSRTTVEAVKPPEPN